MPKSRRILDLSFTRSILYTHSTIDYFDCSFTFDNKSLYKICSRELKVQQPDYFTVNQVVSHVATSITSFLRFGNETSNSYLRSYSELFYLPRVQYAVCSYSPFYPIAQSCCQFSTADITKVCFNPGSALIDCNLLNGNYLSSLLLYRGDNVAKDINGAIKCIVSNKRMNFMNWKAFMNYIHNSIINEGDVSEYILSLCFVSNNCAISEVFNRIDKVFDSLYEKQTLVRSYIDGRMEELEFKKAREDLAELKSDYKDYNNYYCDDENVDDL